MQKTRVATTGVALPGRRVCISCAKRKKTQKQKKKEKHKKQQQHYLTTEQTEGKTNKQV